MSGGRVLNMREDFVMFIASYAGVCYFRRHFYKYFPLVVHIRDTIHASLTKTETGFQTTTFDCYTSSHKLIFIHFGKLGNLCWKSNVLPFSSALKPFHGFQLYVRSISKVLWIWFWLHLVYWKPLIYLWTLFCMYFIKCTDKTKNYSNKLTLLRLHTFPHVSSLNPRLRDMITRF